MVVKQKLKKRFANILPPLSGDEFAALKASCKRGIRDPILVDEDGNVLDGHHRLQIDPNAPRKVVKGLRSDAEKKAFIFQLNFARRNLTPAQKRQLALKMRDVARALRKQDHKKYTLEVVAGMLGVNSSTVSRWLKPVVGTNLHMQNSSHSRQDARNKLTASQRHEIEELVEAGEPQAEIAKQYSVSRKTVSKTARKAPPKRASDGDTSRPDSGRGFARNGSAVAGQDENKLAYLQARVVHYLDSNQDEVATRLKEDIRLAKQGDEHQAAAAILSLYELEQSYGANIDRCKCQIRRIEESIDWAVRFAELAPGSIDFEKCEEGVRLLSTEFSRAQQTLEQKADEVRKNEARRAKKASAT